MVDAHNAVFAPPWSRLPGAVAAMNRCDLVLVHNAEARALAAAAGVAAGKLRVLEDPPPLLAPAPAPAEAAPYVLVPCSFRPDEPIPVLLAAARRLPEVGFRITGSRRRAAALGFVAAAPGNVTFTDYLPLEAFERLLGGAAVVLGLTSMEGVQLSVANEALGAERALVLSDTRILRAMFGEAALFAPNTPEGLAAALARGAGPPGGAAGPQRGAEGAPAGGLARRGRRGGAAGRIRLHPGRTAGPARLGNTRGTSMQITPVILCGGSGTRLWPLSRASYPKQFAPFLGAQSLFQEAALRLTGPGFAPPLVVTSGEFRFLATGQLAEVGIDPGAVLLEPEGRNTAPAVLAAALHAARHGAGDAPARSAPPTTPSPTRTASARR